MSLSMHSATRPGLRAQLDRVLRGARQAQAHADARHFSSTTTRLRLRPTCCAGAPVPDSHDGVKVCWHASSAEAPKWEDNETTLDEVRARLRTALDYVASFDAARIDGTEAAESCCRHARASRALHWGKLLSSSCCRTSISTPAWLTRSCAAPASSSASATFSAADGLGASWRQTISAPRRRRRCGLRPAVRAAPACSLFWCRVRPVPQRRPWSPAA